MRSGERGRDERGQITARIPFGSDESFPFDTVLAIVRALGGEMLSAACEIKLQPEGPTISRGDFISIATERGLSKTHRVQAWRQGIRASRGLTPMYHRDNVPQEQSYLNLVTVLEAFRIIESGSVMRYGFGPTYWNLYAQIINERMAISDQVPVLLPWDDELHPHFDSPRAFERLGAAEALTERYQELSVAANQTPVSPPSGEKI